MFFNENNYVQVCWISKFNKVFLLGIVSMCNRDFMYFYVVSVAILIVATYSDLVLYPTIFNLIWQLCIFIAAIILIPFSICSIILREWILIIFSIISILLAVSFLYPVYTHTKVDFDNVIYRLFVPIYITFCFIVGARWYVLRR